MGGIGWLGGTSRSSPARGPAPSARRPSGTPPTSNSNERSSRRRNPTSSSAPSVRARGRPGSPRRTRSSVPSASTRSIRGTCTQGNPSALGAPEPRASSTADAPDGVDVPRHRGSLLVRDRTHAPLPELVDRVAVFAQIKLGADEDERDVGGVMRDLGEPLWGTRGGRPGGSAIAPGCRRIPRCSFPPNCGHGNRPESIPRLSRSCKLGARARPAHEIRSGRRLSGWRGDPVGLLWARETSGA